MASFELPNAHGQGFLKNSSGQPIIWLQLGAKIKLDFVTPAPHSGADQRDIRVDPASVIVDASVTARTATKLTFSVEADAPAVVKLVGLNAGGAAAASAILVAGDFMNQPGMDIDLLANICRRFDPVKTVKVQRLLFNYADNIFDQNNAANERKYGHLMCGAVAKGRAGELFGDVSILLYEKPYHEPLNEVTSRSDVKYKVDTISRVRLQIKALLAKGVPVRVGVLDYPIGMHVEKHKLIAWFTGGHTVVIVGCNRFATEFMYIDPWGGGSKMKYEGGIAGAGNPEPCQYMGIFIAESNGTRRVESPDFGDEPNILVQKWDTEGTFKRARDNYLEVVSGPPI
jgi:hypothetical protein